MRTRKSPRVQTPETHVREYHPWCYYSLPYFCRPEKRKEMRGIDGHQYQSLSFTEENAELISRRGDELVILERKEGIFQAIPARELPERFQFRNAKARTFRIFVRIQIN